MPKQPSASDGAYRITIVLNQSEKDFLRDVTIKKYGHKNLGAFNRAIADGELIILNLPDEIFEALEAIALKTSETLENFIYELIGGLIPLPTLPESHYSNLIPEQNTNYTKNDAAKISFDSNEQELSLRALASRLGFTIQMGSNTGDGSITHLNRYIAHGLITVTNIKPELFAQLTQFCKDSGFNSPEALFYSIVKQEEGKDFEEN